MNNNLKEPKSCVKSCLKKRRILNLKHRLNKGFSKKLLTLGTSGSMSKFDENENSKKNAKAKESKFKKKKSKFYNNIFLNYLI